MIEKKVNTSFFIADFEELSEQEKNLIIKAKHALKTSYSSYSGFSVGASILFDDETTLEGSNQENVAYPSGLCAERVALFYAGSKYPNKIIKTIIKFSFIISFSFKYVFKIISIKIMIYCHCFCRRQIYHNLYKVFIK